MYMYVYKNFAKPSYSTFVLQKKFMKNIFTNAVKVAISSSSYPQGGHKVVIRLSQGNICMVVTTTL